MTLAGELDLSELSEIADHFDAHGRELGGPFWHELPEVERARIVKTATSYCRSLPEPVPVEVRVKDLSAEKEAVDSMAFAADRGGVEKWEHRKPLATAVLQHAARLSAVSPSVKVKPLVWTDCALFEKDDLQVARDRLIADFAHSITGTYGVVQGPAGRYEIWLGRKQLTGALGSRGEAKAAAQQDYANRILSVIDLSALPVDSREPGVSKTAFQVELQKIAATLGEANDPFAAWERLELIIATLRWYADPRAHTTLRIAEAEAFYDGQAHSSIERPAVLKAKAMDGFVVPVILSDAGKKAAAVLRKLGPAKSDLPTLMRKLPVDSREPKA